MTGENEAPTDVASRNYDRVARVYEELSRLYSFGLIRRAKNVELRYMRPGDRVLYLGAGSGDDAVRAAARGVHVTAIDLSATMIGRLRRRLDARELSADLVVGDALAHSPAEPYDAVCGNYFYNVFGPADMERVFAHTIGYVRPGGRLMVADMAIPEGALGLVARGYLKLGLGFFRLLGLATGHPLYDYARLGARHGLIVETVHDFRLGGHGPALYRTVILRRPELSPHAA